MNRSAASTSNASVGYRIQSKMIARTVFVPWKPAPAADSTAAVPGSTTIVGWFDSPGRVCELPPGATDLPSLIATVAGSRRWRDRFHLVSVLDRTRYRMDLAVWGRKTDLSAKTLMVLQLTTDRTAIVSVVGAGSFPKFLWNLVVAVVVKDHSVAGICSTQSIVRWCQTGRVAR